MHTTHNALNARALAFDATAPMSETALAYWALRVGAACCFIGHGAFGFITKAAWLPYFGVVGIPESVAWKMMPLVGGVDVLAAMAVLFAPRALPLVYMTVWATWTALLRPLAGQGVFEAIERAGNYGVPLALLLLTAAPRSWSGMFDHLDRVASQARARELTISVLKWTTVMLLFGHGALGAITGKPTLTTHYAALGLDASTTAMVGWAEIALAAVVAIRPMVGVLVGIAVWKLASESLYLVAGAPVWEFVERGGSYAAPIALAALLRARAGVPNVTRAEKSFADTTA